ncbi:unnamed protein product [Cochlearia groenlandica]
MNQEEHILNIGGEGSTSCFSDMTTSSSKPIYSTNPIMTTVAMKSSQENNDDDVTLSLLYNLSTIQERVHQIQSLVSFFMISTNNQSLDSTSSSLTIESFVQDIITAASSMLFVISSTNNNDQNIDANFIDHGYMHESSSYNVLGVQERGQISFLDQATQKLDFYGTNEKTLNPKKDRTNTSKPKPGSYEILELDVADLLAKYTHYCQICGKGFKRDANLRMHMRAHGDEYKTREALIRPISSSSHDDDHKKVEHSSKKHYYSCPQQGCRWNQRHDKFQPLKSMICAKNHYKRSHCPKMYMCRRCTVKNFSVLSDLRTHEKHCGDVKWVCSCGTKFSRKDKLVSHVSLFLGHSPAHGPK